MKSELIKAVAKGCLIAGITIGFISCGQKKAEDSKEVAEEHNEAKFDKADEKDAQFLVDVAETNFEEIELGKLAQKQGMISDVQEFGQLMQEQHAAMLATLQSLANSKGVTLPTTITDDGQKAYKKLLDKPGKDFDKEYTDMMVDGHKKNIDKFETMAASGKDSDIRAFATNALPSLRMHLDHAMVAQAACKSKK